MQHMCRNDPEENQAPVRGWVKRHARTVFLTVGTLMLISELWKQLCLTFLLNGGRYQWPFFPFQLCSVSMYACILLYFCWGTEFGNVLLTFVKDFVLLAGMLAFYGFSRGRRSFGKRGVSWTLSRDGWSGLLRR